MSCEERRGIRVGGTVRKHAPHEAVAQCLGIGSKALGPAKPVSLESICRIESALPRPPSVEALADEFAMSQRTLSRHVREATGKSTMALVQSVRLNRARMLIESSRMTIDRVAEQVGYEDATALRRLMRKMAGVNPSRYRKAGARP